MRDYLFGFIWLFMLLVIWNNDVYTAEPSPPDTNTTEKKLEKLIQSNTELNKYFSGKSWDKIYGKLLESRQSEATNFILQNRNTFITERKRSAPWFLSWKTKTLSVWIDGSDGLTSNIVKMKIKFFPFKTYKDTTYHYWKYHNSEWYLIDFGNDISREWKQKIGEQ